MVKRSAKSAKKATKKPLNVALNAARAEKRAAMAPILAFEELFASAKKSWSLYNNVTNSYETGVLPSAQAYRCMLCKTSSVSIGAAARHYGLTRGNCGCPRFEDWKAYVEEQHAIAPTPQTFQLLTDVAQVSVPNFFSFFRTNQ
jgi:hypothetical protein